MILVVSTLHGDVLRRKLELSGRLEIFSNLELFKTAKYTPVGDFLSLLKCTLAFTCSQNHRTYFIPVFLGLLTKYLS